MSEDRKLLFVFSLPRSGSTLLQTLLSNNSQIKTFAEPWLLLPLVGLYKDLGERSDYDSGLARKAIADLLGHSASGLDGLRASIKIMCESIYRDASAGNGVYFLDKTPRYYLIIDEIVRIFPDAKFIFLTRDLLSTYKSVKKTWYYGTNVKGWEHYRDLVVGPTCLFDAYREHSSRSFLISYEDLVSSPEDVLRNIFRYLELDYEPGALSVKRKFSGNMGDKVGDKKYSSVSSSAIGVSKRPISMMEIVQQRRYLNKFSKELIFFFGSSTPQLKLFPIGILFVLDNVISNVVRHTGAWRAVTKLRAKLRARLR